MKKDKLPRFLYSCSYDGEREYVLHTRSPAVLARVLTFTVHDEADWMEVQKKYDIGARCSNKDGYYIIVPELWFEPPMDKDQKDADNLAGLFRRMADWWLAYCKELDKLDE